ncbi:ORF6N domain-containing protein [Lacrimispora sp.]|uniref:ORF6N domain-containing protein n=1 Tax=Lacrimispora sp. TaxID=2719234 RepID=UPI0028AB05CD|nr:ORF6N domain-containing protein [Lacrimispora sp.]
MNELTVKGKQNFMGLNIPVVLGGFGEDKKCLSDKTIAEIHGMNAFDVRRRISDNINRFKENIDLIDLKQRMHQAQTLEILLSLGYAKQSITQADHIYILSERGYAKLIKIMDSDLAWEIHDKLIDEYFMLREEKKEAKAHAERLASVNNAVKILTPMLEKAGCSSQIQLLTAKSLYEKAGVLIPIEIQADKQYWDTVHIARRVGIYYKTSGKPADKAVNEIIRRIGISEADYTETWESKGNWQGTVRKYSDEVIDRIACWLADNDYPDKIQYEQSDGQKKHYHVVCRREAA